MEKALYLSSTEGGLIVTLRKQKETIASIATLMNRSKSACKQVSSKLKKLGTILIDQKP